MVEPDATTAKSLGLLYVFFFLVQFQAEAGSEDLCLCIGQELGIEVLEKGLGEEYCIAVDRRGGQVWVGMGDGVGGRSLHILVLLCRC